MANAQRWEEPAWRALVRAIKAKKCTPFLGAGACDPVLPLGKDLARQWAREYKYPFKDSDNLVRVAQFAAVQGNDWALKNQLCEMFKSRGEPDFGNPNEIHRLVADLELPIYITTNYDDFMARAIQHTGRTPQQVICRWYEERLRRQPRRPLDPNVGGRRAKASEEEDDWLQPTPGNPVVFHLHGTWSDEESMVLTEDDYLDFLIYTHGVIPARIEQAFNESSLLFVGYSFEDLNFKVLFRKLATRLRLNLGRLHAAVQLDPVGEVPTPEERARAENQRRYLEQHFQQMSVRIFWGTCEQFAAELRPYL